MFEDADGIHYLINNVKVTFFYYPFNIKGEISVTKNLQMPNLLTLAAMKFYAMGRRAKWKDYVDIHLLLKNHFSIQGVGTKAIELFENAAADCTDPDIKAWATATLPILRTHLDRAMTCQKECDKM